MRLALLSFVVFLLTAVLGFWVFTDKCDAVGIYARFVCFGSFWFGITAAGRLIFKHWGS